MPHIDRLTDKIWDMPISGMLVFDEATPTHNTIKSTVSQLKRSAKEKNEPRDYMVKKARGAVVVVRIA